MEKGQLMTGHGNSEPYRGDVSHYLLVCPALGDKRENIINMWFRKCHNNIHLTKLLEELLSNKLGTELFQFLLDPATVPRVIRECQEKLYTIEEVFYLSRTWCYSIHRRRLQLSGKLTY